MGHYIKFPKRDKPPAPADKPKPARVTRQRRKRMNSDAEYLAIVDVYSENNPTCAGCGAPFKQFHHFARGPDRGATLTNTDLGMGGCCQCHKLWDDKGKIPIARQFAIKFNAMLRRYQEITRKRVSTADVIEYLQGKTN